MVTTSLIICMSHKTDLNFVSLLTFDFSLRVLRQKCILEERKNGPRRGPRREKKEEERKERRRNSR